MDKELMMAACKRITTHTSAMRRFLEELSNCPEDDIAYDIMHCVEMLHEEIEAAQKAGMDEHGKDVLDSCEHIAQAIRNAAR